MIILIVIGIIIFLWWSLVPAKTQEHNLNDLINKSQTRNGINSNVYKTKSIGRDFFYVSKSPKEDTDVKVFSGTENECNNYMFRHNS